MIQPLTNKACRYVCMHMRESDKRTIFPFLYSEDLKYFAHSRYANRGSAWSASRDGVVCAIGGIVPSHPGVGSLWFIGTDKWRCVMVEVTRFARDLIARLMIRGPYHRIEAACLASDQRAIDYARTLGFSQESIMVNLGKNREDYCRMALTK